MAIFRLDSICRCGTFTQDVDGEGVAFLPVALTLVTACVLRSSTFNLPGVFCQFRLHNAVEVPCYLGPVTGQHKQVSNKDLL